MDIRDLGLVIMSNLSAEAHVERVYLQSSKTLGLLTRSTRQLSQTHTLRIFYYSNARRLLGVLLYSLESSRVDLL